jgi:threonyl-tRNA synthetase
MLVIGEKEMNAQSAALRIQGKGDQGVFEIAEIITRMVDEIEHRK